jgi:hypothetical protein
MKSMEAIGSSETSVATQRTTRRHIPEDDTLHKDWFRHPKVNRGGYTATQTTAHFYFFKIKELG